MPIKNLLLLVLIGIAMIQVFVYLLGPSVRPSVRLSVRHLSFPNLFICVFAHSCNDPGPSLGGVKSFLD